MSFNVSHPVANEGEDNVEIMDHQVEDDIDVRSPRSERRPPATFDQSRGFDCSQRLLGCQSGHGGAQSERLVSPAGLILQLHHWDVEHHHGPIGDPNLPHGNGVLLWFEVHDFDAALGRAAELRAEIVLPRHRNPQEKDGGPNHWEVWLRDPDGYTVVLASPDGSADGDWKP